MPVRRCLIKTVVAVLLVAGAPVARADDARFAIYMMKVDGTAVRKVAQAPGEIDHTSPRWSHDDKRIVFDASGGPVGRQFFVVNADGSGLRQLGIDGRADWSPDDKQLGFETRGNGPEIHVQNLDGQGREKIAQGYCVRWSPDGGQLAVNDRHQLIVLDLATGEERQLFEEPMQSIFGGYNWSPDGKWLAVCTRPKAGVPRQLILVSSDGSQQGLRVRFEGEHGGSISFSPDGKTVVFDNGYKLYLLDVDGDKPPRLISGQEGKNKDPHWSHDGTWILFSSDRGDL